MYRPTIKSNIWLGIMTIAFLILYYWADSSIVTVRPDDYDAKMRATGVMNDAINIIEEYRLPAIDEARASAVDPLVYSLLGEKDSPITTDEGRIEDKITALNPNFAAVVVDLLHKVKVQKGDTIAVLLTGSTPGANIAVLAASQALGITPIIITSVSSSWWGANMPDFTWLDMEKVLLAGSITSYRSVAASIGGSDDHGGVRLSTIGRQLIVDAINRNEVTFIEQGSLSANIDGRMKVFTNNAPLSSYKALINVGGGIAAIGHRENQKLIPTGFSKRIPTRNYPGRGVIHNFSDANIPIININDISTLARRYNLPIAQLPLPEAGKGIMFERKQYNLNAAAIALVLMLVILIVVKYLDRQQYKWREEKMDVDSI